MIKLSGQITSNTLVDYPRLYNLVDYCKETQFIPGSIAEIGVYKGGTARLLCEYTQKHVYLFDTFTGLPQVDKSVDLHNTGDFSDTSALHVSEVLEPYTNYSMYKGIFPKQNSEIVKDLGFSLVHLDVDIYDSVKQCLEFFTPRMTKGGIIVLDDYNAPTCPGAKVAADEYAKLNGLIIEPTVQSQAIIRF